MARRAGVGAQWGSAAALVQEALPGALGFVPVSVCPAPRPQLEPCDVERTVSIWEAGKLSPACLALLPFPGEGAVLHPGTDAHLRDLLGAHL